MSLGSGTRAEWSVDRTQTVAAFALGVALAAACGFRVFVPLLVVSIAAFGGSDSQASCE